MSFVFYLGDDGFDAEFVQVITDQDAVADVAAGADDDAVHLRQTESLEALGVSGVENDGGGGIRFHRLDAIAVTIDSDHLVVVLVERL